MSSRKAENLGANASGPQRLHRKVDGGCDLRHLIPHRPRMVDEQTDDGRWLRRHVRRNELLCQLVSLREQWVLQVGECGPLRVEIRPTRCRKKRKTFGKLSGVAFLVEFLGEDPVAR